MSALRELFNEIGFKVDVGGLRRAEREGDRITDRIADSFKDMGGDIDRVINNVDDSIRGIRDPRIDTTQLRGELDQSRREVEELRLEVNRMEHQFEDTIRNMRRDAGNLENSLGDLAGALGGGVAGSIIGGDIASFAQMPREFQAQLGVDEGVSKGLTEAAKGVWADIPGITHEGAAEAVAASNLYFGAIDDKAQSLGTKIAMLSENSGYEITQLAEAAKQMDDRFADIKSPVQALEMLTEASQKLPRHIFEELIDQTGEYGSNIAAAGMSGNDFFAAMIAGGEKGRYVIDRLGDALSNEFIGRFRGGDEAVFDALGVLGGSTKQVKDWHQAIATGGEDGRQAIREILTEFTSLEDKQKQAALGVGIFGTMFEEQGQDFLPILEDMADGMNTVGVSIDELGVRHEGPLNAIKMKLKETRAEVSEFADGVLGEFGELAGGALPFIGAFVGAGGLGKIGPVVKPVGTFFRTAAPLALGFGKALGAVGLVAGGTIGIIVGLGYAGYQLYMHWDEAKGWILGVFDSLGAGAKSMANSVIGGINGVIGALNGIDVDIPDWVPKYGGQSFGLNIPKIPMLAAGGTIVSPGSVLVGERGPELLTLPAGASVAPLSKSIAGGNMELLNLPPIGESVAPLPKANRGGNDGGYIFAPSLRVIVQGNGDAEQIKRVLKREFIPMMEEYWRRMQRKRPATVEW